MFIYFNKSNGISGFGELAKNIIKAWLGKLTISTRNLKPEEAKIRSFAPLRLCTHLRTGGKDMSFISTTLTMRAVAVILPMIVFFSCASAVAQQQTQPAQPPAAEGNAEELEEELGEGQTADPDQGSVSRFGRHGQGQGLIASQDWAQAGFIGFIDINQRLKQPDDSLLERGLRFVTTDDFAPFNSRDPNGAPEGYHIELSRALCEELATACTMKFAPFADIPDMIANGQVDVALAGISNHPSLQDRLGFSDIYLQRPARFVKLDGQYQRIDAKALAGKPVAVLGGSAHEAYLKTYFDDITRVPVTDLDAARQLLSDKKVIAIFADAFQLLPLLSEINSPFVFAGKPYFDARFFGDGMAIAYNRQDWAVRNLLNYGLLQLSQKGRMAELYARHFALDVYDTY